MIGPDVSAIGATHIGSALGERIISMQAEMEALDEQKELTSVAIELNGCVVSMMSCKQE